VGVCQATSLPAVRHALKKAFGLNADNSLSGTSAIQTKEG
jgi:hypothetical protein